MNKAAVLLVLIVVLSVVFIGGCAESRITTTGEAGAIVSEISSDISDASDKLTDIDNILNGK